VTGAPEPEQVPRELARAVDQLVNRVAHWSPARWASGGHGSRVYALVQQLADLGAQAEGGPRRQVPRLDNDLVLPDQLRVVTVDLLAAEPPAPVLDAALAAVRETRASV
jgi:hypothetical protein